MVFFMTDMRHKAEALSPRTQRQINRLFGHSAIRRKENPASAVIFHLPPRVPDRKCSHIASETDDPRPDRWGPAHGPRMDGAASAMMAACPSSTSALGQKRKSRPTILMSVLPPKAEVAGDSPVIQFPTMSRQPGAKTARCRATAFAPACRARVRQVYVAKSLNQTVARNSQAIPGHDRPLALSSAVM